MNTNTTTVTPTTTAGSTATPAVVTPATPTPRAYHRPELRYEGKISHLTQGVLGEPDYTSLE